MQEINLVELQPRLKKILLIGQEGTGKTHFIGTCPKPIYHFSLDKGYPTLAGEPGITTCLILEHDRRRPMAYREFTDRYKQILAGDVKYKHPDGKEEPYKTVAVDSLTALSTMIFDHIQYANSNIDKKASFTEYQLIKSKTEDIVNAGKRSPLYFVATALIKADKDELTGEIFYLSNMIGSIRDDLGAYFDAVLYMQSTKTADGSIRYEALTVGSRRHRAKLRVPSSIKPGILPAEVPDLGLLNNKIAKAFQQKQKEESNAKNHS